MENLELKDIIKKASGIKPFGESHTGLYTPSELERVTAEYEEDRYASGVKKLRKAVLGHLGRKKIISEESLSNKLIEIGMANSNEDARNVIRMLCGNSFPVDIIFSMDYKHDMNVDRVSDNKGNEAIRFKVFSYSPRWYD